MRKKRVLSVATIRDVIVQKLLYDVIYDDLEAKFKETPKLDSVSWAYRKNKSAPLAIKLIHSYINQGFQFAFDADIIKFFDAIPHRELLLLIEGFFGRDTLTNDLLRRFIKTGGVSCPYRDKKGKIRKEEIFHHYKPNRQEINRQKGIPQGGVLSGILANLYLYNFDCWVVNDLSKRFELRYVRYADDFVILLKKEKDIPHVHNEVLKQLELLKLELHGLDSNKTKYVNIGSTGVKFLGFFLDGNHIRIHEENIEKFKRRIRAQLRRRIRAKLGIPEINKGRIEQDYKFGSIPQDRFKQFISRVIKRVF